MPMDCHRSGLLDHIEKAIAFVKAELKFLTARWATQDAGNSVQSAYPEKN
jgi:predicted nucleic acid-binding Zn ribbon protein